MDKSTGLADRLKQYMKKYEKQKLEYNCARSKYETESNEDQSLLFETKDNLESSSR